MRKKKINILFVIGFNLLFIMVKAQINKADQYYNAGLIHESIEEYEKALLSKNLTEKLYVYKKLAKAYFINQNYAKSLAAYKMIIDSGDSLLREDSYQYAQCLRSIGDYRKAEKVLKNANYDNDLIDKFCNWPATHLTERSDFQITKTHMAMSQKYLGMTFIDSNHVLFSKSYFNEKNKTGGYQIRVGNVKDDLFLNDLGQLFGINNTFFESAPYFNSNTQEIFYSKNYLSKTYYLGNDGDKRKVNQHFIFRAKIEDGEIKQNESLPFNSPDYFSSFPFLYKDSVLFFCSNNSIGKGGMDIFYVTRDANGNWSSDLHFLSGPNTFEDEVFPFIWNDNFYFSSRGYEGYGGMDIYRGKLHYTNGEFSVSDITNIGLPVNSTKDDFGLFFITESKGYFASNRNSLYDEVYLLEVLNNAQKLSVKHFTKDNKSAPIHITICDLNANNRWVPQKVVSVKPDEKWQFDNNLTKTQKLVFSTTYGKYSFLLKKNEHPNKETLELMSHVNSLKLYETLMNHSLSDFNVAGGVLSVEISDGIYAEIDLESDGISSGLTMPLDLSKTHPVFINETTKQVYYNNGDKLMPIVDNPVDSLAGIKQLSKLIFIKNKLSNEYSNYVFTLSFNDTKSSDALYGLSLTAYGYFDYNSFELNYQHKELLSAVDDELKNNVFLNVSIEGYTDGIGSVEYNNVLSVKRANSCREFLIYKGISSDRIFSKGMGEKPFSQYHNYQLRNTDLYVKSRKVRISLFFIN